MSKSYLTLTDSILRSLTGAHHPNHKNQKNHIRSNQHITKSANHQIITSSHHQIRTSPH
ncbi:MAG: hypothetical protein IPN86_14995 [Saprospiraceae bacterium]|nr:hypothetical protein [Saprospiraceae bacterium]